MTTSPPQVSGPHRETVEIAVAGGEVEAGQIIIAPVTKPLRDVEFTVSVLEGPDGVVLPEAAVTLSVILWAISGRRVLLTNGGIPMVSTSTFTKWRA